ncbi:MAG TPA: SDR family oxidoreductase [Acidimicrobiia bacterium]|nr:SDR family oxidoreductase [Acidimicrobiia bacterium]
MTEPKGAKRSAFDLSGHVALVTGGNGGIGLGMALALAGAGADVAIWGRRKDKNEAAAEQLRATGRQVVATVCDVSDEQQVAEAFAEAVGTLGKVDSVFANAGAGFRSQPFTETSLQDWRATMAINLDGVFLTLREGARHLVERGEGGSLVAVSSTSSVHGAPRNSAYAVSKTGLLALVRSLAVELARHQIRVNAIVPGWTETEMTEKGRQYPKFVENTTSRTPVRRWGVPADFGPVAVFLADPAQMFHTGDAITIDGGYTIF